MKAVLSFGVVALLLAQTGCTDQSGASLSTLIGTEVVVTAAPTVIVAGGRSEVRENQWQGLLVSVDDQWVVIQFGRKVQAIDRPKVVAIASAGE